MTSVSEDARYDGSTAETVALLDTEAAPDPELLDPPEQYRRYPAGVLPEPLRPFVVAAASAIGCAVEYIALPLLAATAAAIGNTRRIQLKRGWTEPPILWSALVGESGSHKSPAQEVALRPVHKRQRQALREHAEAMERYGEERLTHERDLAAWKKSKTGAPPPERPTEPVAERFVTADTTVEALASLLSKQPRGLLVAVDELSGLIGGFDRYNHGRGGADAAHWLEMFGARPLVVDRKTSGTTSVPRAAVCVTGGTQPATLERILGQDLKDAGLLARLLLAMPPARPRQWSDAEIPPQVEAQVSRLFERLYAFEPDRDDDGEPYPATVVLGDDAKRIWVAWYNAHGEAMADLSGDLAAAESKLEGYAGRFALVIHCCRVAAGDATVADPLVLDAESMRAALKLTDWHRHETARIYATFGESRPQKERRQLVEWIARRGGATTERELRRGPRRYRNAGAARAALAELERVGLLVVEPEPAGSSRSTPRYVLRQVATDDDDDERAPPLADARPAEPAEPAEVTL